MSLLLVTVKLHVTLITMKCGEDIIRFEKGGFLLKSEIYDASDWHNAPRFDPHAETNEPLYVYFQLNNFPKFRVEVLQVGTMKHCCIRNITFAVNPSKNDGTVMSSDWWSNSPDPEESIREETNKIFRFYVALTGKVP